MTENRVVALRQKGAIDDPLTEILRAGARRLIAQAVEAEFETFLVSTVDLVLPDGRQRVVRHGHDPVRAIQTGIGPVEVQKPKARDRGATAAARIRFTSNILPKWARRTKSLDALLPVLYLRGISAGDFQEALAALLGKDAPNLSAAVIARLKSEWEDEYRQWQKRDLSARHYVYVWADGVYLQARMEPQAELYRTRFFGQTVGLCGAPERVVMPSGASVVRASVAVLLDQPFGVVAGGEGADGVSDVVDGLEDTSVHDLLLEGSEQALDDAIGLRLSDEGVARRDAPGADLFLESVRHEVAAVIMPQRQAAGGVGVDAVELVSHRHADGLKSFEAGPTLCDMPPEQLGVPVLGDAEQPDLAVLDGNDLGRVGRPHHVRRLGDDPPIVRRVGARASAMGRQQAMLAHEPQQAFA